MKRSNRLVILVGVLLAVLAFVGVVIVLNSTGNGTSNEPVVQKVTVLVATEDIKIGDPVTPDKVGTLEVAPDAVVGTPFHDTSQVNGQRAIYDILKDTQVSQEALGLGQAGTYAIEEQLEPGEKAIAFQVDRVTGLDFLLRPGDHIDIVLGTTVQVLQPTQDTAGASPGEQRFEPVQGLEAARTVKTILTDKRVLYVSATRNRSQPAATPSPGQTAAPASTDVQSDSVIIVFAGTDQDAEVIKFAQNDFSIVGPLTAVLRRAADADEGVPEEETTGITIDILFDQYGIPIPNIIQQLGPSQSPAP